ncbi:DUF192 domain-containing protein [Methylopila musalis]|uniref:DUF192 domain-containing protein n=1 Tax=Methylopila musalis TaxID=1134781 RepID=A0ABW3ZAB8_9HYPH
MLMLPRALRIALFALLALVAAGASVSMAGAKLEPLTFQTSAGPRVVQVELADTPERRQIGLMYRRTLAPDHGMLFDFGAPQPVAMWMKNTYLSLDMVFVTEKGLVHRIERGAEPLSEAIIDAGAPVRFVVELAAGEADRLGLKPGDRVSQRLIDAAARR